MEQSPDPIEAVDFKLKQLCRLKIPGGSYDISKTTSLLTSSNAFGLIFVGTSDSVLAIKIADIVSLDQATPSKKTEISEYPCRKINLQSTPYFLGLSCDSLTLLVCIQKSGCPVALLFDVRGYARKDGDWSPFQEVRLSATDGVTVSDCAWNPTLPELLAVSLSDGSLVAVEVKDTQFTLNSLPSSTGIQVISWSPKGKQLAAARSGCITQYKPDLKEAKSIPIKGAELNMGKAVACGIQWLSTSQFLVTYVDEADSSARPHLFIVNSFKNGTTKLIDYDDVCFGNMTVERPFRYTTASLPPWNVILASSATAMEIVVLGQSSATDPEHPEWTQWTLEDEFRAELPLTPENDETRPVGMTVDTSSQLPIPWTDNQQLPPMPILFVLNSSGLLCPFHVLNLQKGATPFNQAPQEISSANERKGMVVKTAIETKTPLAASTPLAPQSRPSFFKPAAESAGPTAPINSFAKLSENQTSKGFSFAQPTAGQTQPTVKENQAPANLPQAKPAPASFSVPPPQPAQAVPKSTTFGGYAESAAAQAKPSATPSAKTEADESGIGAARAVLNDEVTKFVQEMCEFKARSSSVKIEIASEQDKQRLMKLTAEMGAFGEELVDTTKTQDEEVRGLCTELVDLAALLDDARMRHARRKNSRYNHLLKLRPLDPANRRKMDSIESLHIHIEQQLEEASRILDSISSARPKDQNRKLEIPITQVIYEAMKNNAKVISQLKSRVERLKAQSKEQQLKIAGAALDALRCKEPEEARKWDNDLASLADSLLSVRMKQGGESLSTSSIQPVIHQVSPEKQAMLRSVLAQRPVARIRAARPESASESRLLSNLSVIMQQEDRKETTLSSLDSSRLSQKTLASPAQKHQTQGLSSSVRQSPTVLSAKPQQTAEVEDITPPSTPVNFEQKAKALSGQSMISSLSFLASAGSPQQTNLSASTVLKPNGAASFSSVSKPASKETTTASQPASVTTASSAFSSAFSGFSTPTPQKTGIFGLSGASATVPVSTAGKIGAEVKDSASSPAQPKTPQPLTNTQPFKAFAPASNQQTSLGESNSKKESFADLAKGFSFGTGAKPPVSASLEKPETTQAQATTSSDSKPSSTSAFSTVPTAFGFGAKIPSTTAAIEVSQGSVSSTSQEKAGEKATAVSSSLFGTSTLTTPTNSAPSMFGASALSNKPSFTSLAATSTSATTTTSASAPSISKTSSAVNLTPTTGGTSFSLAASTAAAPKLFGTTTTTTTASVAPPSGFFTSTTTSAPTSSVSTGPPAGLFKLAAATCNSATATQATAPLFGTAAVTTSASTAPPAGFFKLSTASSDVATSSASSAPPTGFFKLSSVASDASTSSASSGPPAGLFASSAASSAPPTGFFKLSSNANDAATSSASSAPPTGLFKLTSSIGATATTQAPSTFGTPSTTTTASAAPPTGLFKLTTTVTPTAGSTAPPAGFFKLSSSGFDASSGSAFGKPAVTSPSPFTNTFGQGLLGQPTTTSASTGSLFGQQPAPSSASSASVFGQPSKAAAAAPVFGAQPVFGQSSSVLGQNSTQNAQPLFGGSAFPASQSTTATTTASSSSSGFGAGLFGSMGLGSNQNPANAQRNVFGGSATFGSSPAGQGLFGAASSSGFGAQSPPPAQAPPPAFSSPPSSPFGGAFGQSQPAFGGAATFAGSPQFGSRPTFGGGPTFGSPTSSSLAPRPEATGFGALAASNNVPSFGGLASSGPTFGSLAQSGNTQPAFGGAAFPQNNPPSFGGGSSFSTWR